MEHFFLEIFNRSITAGWLILAVILVRHFIKKAPGWITCMLWGLVLIRLIVPLNIESAFSLIPSETAETFYIDSGFIPIDNALNPVLDNSFTADVGDSANPLQIWIPVCTAVWAVGTGGMFLYALFSYVRLKRKVSDSACISKRVFLCGKIKSPFILGIVKPEIYLPYGMEERMWECVMEHEKSHIKRGDHIWKPLGFLVLSVYWFHPLCWIAYILLCRDIESACDERATKKRDNGWRADYCQALLELGSERRMIAACPVAFGEVGMKERVKKILNYKKPAIWVLLAAVTASVVVCICFMTNPKKSIYVQIRVPQGADGTQIIYSNEQISSASGKVVVSSVQGQNDALIVLKPVELQETKGANSESGTYPQTYISSGLTAEIKVEKGVWYHVGVKTVNEVQDTIYYVPVKKADVRIPAVAQYVQALETVRMRSADSGEADMVGILEEGARLELIEMQENGWSKVLYKNQEAWVKSEFLKVVEAEDGEVVSGDGQTAQKHKEAKEELEQINKELEELENKRQLREQEEIITTLEEKMKAAKKAAEQVVLEKKYLEDKLELVNKWAMAFCARNAEYIQEYASSKVQEDLKKRGILTETDKDGVMALGGSSPMLSWPDAKQSYIILQDNSAEDQAQILYYAWVSDPDVWVWKESITCGYVDGKYVVVGEELKKYESISSGSEFKEAYPFGINNTGMDYSINGMGEALNKHAVLSGSNAYKAYFEPISAARRELHLLDNENKVKLEAVETDDPQTVDVVITFREDNVTQKITMIKPWGEVGIWVVQDKKE